MKQNESHLLVHVHAPHTSAVIRMQTGIQTNIPLQNANAGRTLRMSNIFCIYVILNSGTKACLIHVIQMKFK